MNECIKRGCRRIKYSCEDCGRVVSTAQRQDDESEWVDIDKFTPPADAPCEYKILVTCRGWYRPNGDEARFAPDDRMAPQAKFTHWRIWKDAPSFQEGIELVREFREQKFTNENIGK